MNKTIIVTGANGFLGKHTVQSAMDQKWTVKAVVRSQKAAQVVQQLGATPIILNEFTEEIIRPIIRDAQAIINFIGITMGTEAQFQQVNVGTVKTLLDAALQEHVPRIIIPSGLGVDQVGHRFWANNGYFRSKLAIENVCQQSKQAFVLFRPSFILGPGDELIPWLIPQILQGKVDVVGSGITPMQPIFVMDATQAFLNAAVGMGPDRYIYDLVGPKTINFLDLVHLVRKILEDRKKDLPPLQIDYVSLQNAVDILGMNPDDVDVMQCDVVGDSSGLVTNLNLKLTPLENAAKAAIDDFFKTSKKL